ncbi:transglycosylase domain-containing protein [Litchfieldia salsa]|uniref:Penicillin-binding protein n=1 Tax=Litchfieldia salsa TaxID=930152 RepID=A0A1H0P5W1_9BACI|nr:transglycosylase domain-containing protein [Litchfieldia salsa]SDP00351.1 penicillin-binding protein [Litchfieldia salsa]
MNFNKSQWKERLQSFGQVLTNKQAWKGIRITYNVIWNLFLIFLIIGLIGLSFAGGVGAGYFASLVKTEPVRAYESMQKDIYNYEETTEVYFDHDIYLGTLRTDLEREEVDLSEISPHLINAVIATEDEYFYEHNGVVPKAIMRALLQEVTNSPMQSGGSTLTQQLIKNQILTNEVSFDRKAKEILLAMRLEKFFEKDDILEAYLNIVSFGRNSNGRNIAGVQAAAKGLFGVEAKDLTIAQAAFIAGIPQNPYAHTPFYNKPNAEGLYVKDNLEPGLERMNTVLRRMLSAKFITQEQYEEALAFDLRSQLIKPLNSSRDDYPWLTAEVEERAANILIYKIAEEDGYEQSDLDADEELKSYYNSEALKQLRQNGYRIYTTIDKNIYDSFQKVVDEFAYYGNDKKNKKPDPETGEAVFEPLETGAVLIENKTGKIISFVGGRDFNREELNHATKAIRPNGSTMKPLLDYAPAFEYGTLQPGSVLADVPYKYPGSPKQVHNYGGAYDYKGLMSVRHALKLSRNVPAVKAYVDNFNRRPLTFLEKMGFTSLVDEDEHAYAVSLGGLTYGVSVEENVNAYATFANEGKFIDGYMIEKITTKDGDIVYEHKVEAVDVFSPQTAYLTIDTMRDVIRSGTATSLYSHLKFNSDWAGKTGTGQDLKDVWFVATNPNVSFGTWMGYDTPKPVDNTYKGVGYSQRNIMLWAKLMNAAYDIRPDLVDPEASFKMPGGIVRRSYCVLSGLIPSALCSEAGLVESDIFNAKFVPTKVDDSLTKGKYIVVDDKAYRVPANAPAEFVQEGVMIKKEFLEYHKLTDTKAIEKILPNTAKWKNLVITEDKEVTDNGAVPSTVNASIAGSTLWWKKHDHNDVLGYRIYRANNFTTDFKRIGSVPARDTLQFNVGNSIAAYYVTAVDVNGNETPLSQSTLVKSGDYQQEKPKVEAPPEPPPVEPAPPEEVNPPEEKPQPPKPEGQGEQDQN